MAWIKAVAAGGAEAVQAFEVKQLKIQETKAYREAANRTMAASTREMAEEQRNKELMHSRAIALAAFSGGGVDDPGVVKILADINAEGEYRVMSKLWRGQDEAAGLIFRSEAAEREGDAALTAGASRAVTSAMSSYGGGFGGGSS